MQGFPKSSLYYLSQSFKPTFALRNIGSNVKRSYTLYRVFPERDTVGVRGPDHGSPFLWRQMQLRGVRTKPEPPRVTLPTDQPTPDEELMFQRMLEQREINIVRVAKEKGWFSPQEYLHPPEGWSYEWADWVAGWEVVPIVSRSHTDLVLEHYFGMAGKFTPVIFQMDPSAPNFVFRYEGMDAQDAQRKGSAWVDQGCPGAYYYYRMGDDELFKLPGAFDGLYPEDFLRAAASDGQGGSRLQDMVKELTVVPELPDGDESARAFAEDCDLELIHFEQRLAALENEGKEKPVTMMALGTGGDTEEPLYPLTDEKIQALRQRYQSYKAYGVYSVYSLASDDTTQKVREQRRKQIHYLEGVSDLEGRIHELKEELHEIKDDEGEFEIIKPQSQGRKRKVKRGKKEA
ncbi:hypothetical protein GYMLUDRAFT_65867 [Collybiopsis luxurians FD-317 M1]|nr:hypothetical protein GYMLUDRAFT_65867 [Collybiopsis luxurians FD-317 M1]